MKIKTFRIRTDHDQAHQDEQLINQFMENVRVKKTAAEFVPDKVNHWSVLVCYEELLPKNDSLMGPSSDKIAYPSDTVLNNEEGLIFNKLKQWRQDMAAKTRLQGYMICHTSELVSIAKTKPKNLEELARIKGFSSRKLLKYGGGILALLNSE